MINVSIIHRATELSEINEVKCLIQGRRPSEQWLNQVVIHTNSDCSHRCLAWL